MKFFNYKVAQVCITDTDIGILLEDGRKATSPLADFPILFKATSSQRQQFEIIDGYAIYWEALDEDLSISGFFENQPFLA